MSSVRSEHHGGNVFQVAGRDEQVLLAILHLLFSQVLIQGFGDGSVAVLVSADESAGVPAVFHALPQAAAAAGVLREDGFRVLLVELDDFVGVEPEGQHRGDDRACAGSSEAVEEVVERLSGWQVVLLNVVEDVECEESLDASAVNGENSLGSGFLSLDLVGDLVDEAVGLILEEVRALVLLVLSEHFSGWVGILFVRRGRIYNNILLIFFFFYFLSF